MRSKNRSSLIFKGLALGLASSLAITLSGCGGSGSKNNDTDSSIRESNTVTTKALLGEALFNDKNLSLNRSQSCATCHNPEHAFIDNRLENGDIPPVSIGDDGFSIGDRNAPTATYAQFSPNFQYASRERLNSDQPDYVGFIGGQFHDGRAADLKGQAEGPPLNPIEMNMASKEDVIARIRSNDNYEEAFVSLYGGSIFNDTDTAYAAMADAIQAFEQTETFAPFDSKYDRSLTGDYTMSIKELRGMSLFFSQQFTSCATCHQLEGNSSRTETFTSYEYHNIGVPVNQDVRNRNGAPLDNGLLNNPSVSALSEQGKFKVATLRNVAVTEPYMHNGVFRDLETVIKFYDHFLADSDFPNNPETGLAWREPEFADTMSLDELKDGRKMDQVDVESMVCFLRTLTDAKYEHLIEEKGISCIN